MTRGRLLTWAVRTEQAAERRLGGWLRTRPSWHVTLVPYIAHGTAERAQIRARVLVRRLQSSQRSGRLGAALTALARYGSVEAGGEQVSIQVASVTVDCVSDPEGYIDAVVDLPGLPAGWHQVTYRLASRTIEGRLLIVDASAGLAVVSDLDDTVIQTGLTRFIDALRTTVLVADDDRLAIAGGAELYQGFIAGAAAQTPVFYVSTGAWNLHQMLGGFLDRTGFPAGPVILTDWGPGTGWAFREDSVAFKTRTINQLIAEYPNRRWVLVGDSGQHDAETYAAIVRAHPDRIRAVYVRDVPPKSALRTARVESLSAEVAALGVPMVLVRDSLDAAEHARGLGLVDDETVERVRVAVS